MDLFRDKFTLKLWAYYYVCLKVQYQGYFSAHCNSVLNLLFVFLLGTVRRYDNATTCGLVWTANFVAYRCRTCGISPCMSLCAECFQKGDHDGHDFNMFRSQAGGACDCGDTSVMKETGWVFCFCYQFRIISLKISVCLAASGLNSPTM